MKSQHLFLSIVLLVISFHGMAQTDIVKTEADSISQVDDAVSAISIDYERDTDDYVYADSINSDEEYIYVTEYEEEKNVLDKVITRLLKTSVDSNYITTNDYGLQVEVSFNTFNSQSNFRWDATADTLPNYCRITSDQMDKIGLWIGYRNFGLGGSLDLKSFGKKTQYNLDLSFSYYGDSWGGDIGVNQTKGNNLYFNNNYTDVSKANVTIFRLYFNYYYVPFYRKFSYNAAFSHSMRQEKSAGSPLFGLSSRSFYLVANTSELPNIMDNESQIPSKITFYSFNLNVGYAHNFVTKKKTLLHISALPYVTIYKKASVSPLPMDIDAKDPRFLCGGVGKVSWIWQREHHLISAFGSLDYNNIIREPMSVSDVVYRVGTCYGFRAYKHYRPHKKKKLKRKKTMFAQ